MLRAANSIRHLRRRGSSHSPSTYQKEGPIDISLIAKRRFFWSSDGNNDGDGDGKGDGNNGGKGEGNRNSSNGKDKDKDGKRSKENKSNGDNGEETVVTSQSSSSSASSSSSLPTRLGFGDEAPRYPHLTALPVISKPLFPGIVTSVTVSDEATLHALEKIWGTGTGTGTGTGGGSGGPGGYVGVFLRKKYPNGVTDGGVIVDHPEIITDKADLYSVGSLAQIHRITHHYGGGHGHGSGHDENDLVNAVEMESTSADSVLHDGKTASVLLLAHRRIDLLSVENPGPPIDVTCSHWDRMVYKMGQDSGKDDVIKALSNEILKTIRELAQHNPLFRENATFFPTRVDSNDPYRLADFASSLTTGSAEDLQDVLEEKDAEIRLQKAHELLSKERECKFSLE